MQFGLEHSVCFQNSIYCDVNFIIKSEIQHYGIWRKLVLETFFLFTYLRTVFFIFFPLYQFIGSKVTDQKADEVSKLGILDFWTPDNHYRWSRSRYGGHMSGSVEPVDRSRLLLCSINIKKTFLEILLESLKALNYMTLIDLLFTF